MLSLGSFVRLETKPAVFDAFLDASGRQAHLGGPIAKALMTNAAKLLAVPLSMERTEFPGSRISRTLRHAD